METEFNFNSSPCTSKVQSERLLALGLKVETADMRYYGLYLSSVDKWYNKEYPEVLYDGEQIHGKDIPAWSLHRLLYMLLDNAPRMFWRLDGANISIEWDDDGTDFFPYKGNMYDGLIDCIEWLIKEGYFNKEYLD